MVANSIDEALLLSVQVALMAKRMNVRIGNLINLPMILPRKRSIIETNPEFRALNQRPEEHLLKETRAIEET